MHDAFVDQSVLVKFPNRPGNVGDTDIDCIGNTLLCHGLGSFNLFFRRIIPPQMKKNSFIYSKFDFGSLLLFGELTFTYFTLSYPFQIPGYQQMIYISINIHPLKPLIPTLPRIIYRGYLTRKIFLLGIGGLPYMGFSIWRPCFGYALFLVLWDGPARVSACIYKGGPARVLA